MSKVAISKPSITVETKGSFFSALFMGCATSRPLTSGSETSGMRPRSKTPSDVTTNYPDTDVEPRVRFDDKEDDNVDDDDYGDIGEADSEYPDFGEVQSNFGDRLMSANARSSRPSSTLFSPSLMMTETVADTDVESLHSDSSIDYRAPSLSLWYDDNVQGDILIQDVYVPSSGLTKQTYYCCLQWNSGINGGGYCGIQDHGKGRNYIFSIWDPIGTTEKIRPIYVGPGTICEPFGGEGTGLKSWNFDLGWDPDSWYTFVCRRWDQDEHTYYGLWVKHHIEGLWSHLVTVDFPVPKTYFETWTCSFLEDWEGTGHNERRVHFKNGYKRKVDETWIPFDKAVFGIVREFSSRQYAENFDSGSFDETFYLQSGGKTQPSMTFTNETVLQKPMLPEPDSLPISCYLTSVTEREIVWEISSGSVPQFQYIIKIDGEFYKQGFNSEVRMCRIDCGIDESVELLIEDLYGKIFRCKYLVREGKELALRMTKSAKLLLNQKTLLEEEEDLLDDIPDDGATDAETLITGVTTPFRGPSVGAITQFTTDNETNYEPSEMGIPPLDYAPSDAGDQTDRSSLRGGTRTSVTMETAMYPPSPGRRSGYQASSKSRTKTYVTLETPMYPHSPDTQAKQASSRRGRTITYATSETVMYQSSPGLPSTYVPSAKSKARTNTSLDTAMYPSSPGVPSTYVPSAKSKARTQFTLDTEMYPPTSGDGSPYPASEKGKAKTYLTSETGMYPSSEGDVSPYPVSARGRAETYLTTDTAMYPSSAGGTLYPASEAGATTMYATSMDEDESEGELGYATSDVDTMKYYTTEGETTEPNPTTETDDESVY